MSRKLNFIINKRFNIGKNYIKILLIINLMISVEKDQRIFQSNYSSITFKIDKSGKHNIFGDSTKCQKGFQPPNIIYINGAYISDIKSEYIFDNSNNTIEFIWNTEPDSTSCLFSNCANITEIDFSNFNSSKVTHSQNMFFDCSSLTSLNLSNFDTSNNIQMNYMFKGCSSLTSLDLSNFDTNNAEIMNNMFEGCSSLVFLDISNFDFSGITGERSKQFDLMFDNCISLEYVNLNNTIIHSSSKINDIFYKASSNLTICSNENIMKKYLLEVNIKINCIDSINEIICYKKYSSELSNNNVCEYCGRNIYQKYEESITNNNNIKCYRSPEGYYLDEEVSLYKKCYSSCKNCNKNGNDLIHNCIECNDDYIYENDLSNFKNCYQNCSNYHYFDITIDKYYCTPYLNCSGFYNKLIQDKNECIENCSKDIEYRYEYENKCYKKCPDNTLNQNFYCIPRMQYRIASNNEEFFDSSSEINYFQIFTTSEVSEYLPYEEFFETTKLSNTDKYENEIITEFYVSHKTSNTEENYEEIIDETKISNNIININTYNNERSTELILEETTYEDNIINDLSDKMLNTDKYENEIITEFSKSDKASFIEETYEEIIDENELSNTLINEDKMSTDLIIEESSYKNIATEKFSDDILNSDKIQTETTKLSTSDKASSIEKSYEIIEDSGLSDTVINTYKFEDKINTDFINEDNIDENKRTNEKSDKYQTEIMKKSDISNTIFFNEKSNSKIIQTNILNNTLLNTDQNLSEKIE